MGRFNGQRVCLRERETNKLIIAYPFTLSGTDEQINRRVKNWFYQVTCSADCHLLTAFVDTLNEDELEIYA